MDDTLNVLILVQGLTKESVAIGALRMKWSRWSSYN